MMHFLVMYAAGPKNPLHGVTLEKMVTELQAHYGWDMLGRMIKINSFNWHPSIKSSLTFLRKTPWARQKVEELYVDSLPDIQAAQKAALEGKEIPTDEPTISEESAEPKSPSVPS